MQIPKKAKGFFAEFREFAVKGNALNLAVAVIVGNAFSSIVNSLVADIITPLLGLVSATGTTDIKHLTLVLRRGVSDGTTAPPLLVLPYGAFLQTIINFLVISLSVFVLFKVLTSAQRRFFAQEEGGATETPQKAADVAVLEEIRDLLKEKK